LLSTYASYYVSGHVHRDEHRVYAPLEELAPGVRAQHEIEFLRVTTGASLPRDKDAYWGYRLLTANGRVLITTPYDPGLGLQSVPAGNLWAETRSPTRILVLNGLPKSTRALLRFRLPRREEGWRFMDVFGHAEVPLVDMAPAANGEAVYMVHIEVPAAPPTQGFPTKPGWQRKRLYEAVPAKGNRPPVVKLAVKRTDAPDEKAATSQPASNDAAAADAATADGATVVFLGETVTVTGEATSDPDGDPLIATTLLGPDGMSVRAREQAFTPASVGRFRFRMDATDGRGAVGTGEIDVAVVLPVSGVGVAQRGASGQVGTQPAPLPPSARGCGCRLAGRCEPGLCAQCLLALLVAWLVRGKRKKVGKGAIMRRACARWGFKAPLFRTSWHQGVRRR